MRSLNGYMGLAGFVALAGVALMLVGYLNPHDDTDPPDGRSGMTLLIDHGTGCQYLYRSGAMTPRMGSDGRQVCTTPTR